MPSADNRGYVNGQWRAVGPCLCRHPMRSLKAISYPSGPNTPMKQVWPKLEANTIMKPKARNRLDRAKNAR